ncbi:MAG: protein kinase UbiB [Candidatus Methanophagaceae archaeon]|nr:MAG: protein kinase UbiB [Methanophagales archaeon]KAF5433208.1 ubiquinone biosynthesis protein [Methanophagales archaeon]
MAIRKIGAISSTYRHINRYREIIAILVKYGFGEVLAKLELQKHLEFGKGKSFVLGETAAEIAAVSHWARVRMALEELGPTFVKFGQMMSTRSDMIPHELITELETLQEAVPPFSTEDAKQIIAEELNSSVDRIFMDFSGSSIAAASIAQVHKAVLPGGEEVAVKIQRPDIDKIIEADLEIMLHLATLAEKYLKETEAIDIVKLVEEFARVIRKELNFRIEAAYIERFANNFQDDTTIHVPKVYKGFSAGKVLTMEFIGGYKVTDITKPEVREHGIDPKVVASRGLDLILKQIFEHGFFHADPHPGNIRVLDGNVICFLDYGMMGRLSARHREDLADIFIGIISRDEHKITKTILKLTGRSHVRDVEELESDIAELIEVYAYGSLKELEIGGVITHMGDVIIEHHLEGPRDFYLLAKALVTIEGVGRELDPEFNAAKHAEPFAKKLIMDRMSPRRLIKDFYHSATEASLLVRDFPAEAREILTLLKQGEANIKFEHRGLDPMLKTFDQITNRMVFAIVLASLVIGSALIVLSGVPPKWHEIPVIGIVGFLGAGIMGFGLLFSILRHGKM